MSQKGVRAVFLRSIPYQTLVASIIHKYVTGRLMEKQA